MNVYWSLIEPHRLISYENYETFERNTVEFIIHLLCSYNLGLVGDVQIDWDIGYMKLYKCKFKTDGFKSGEPDMMLWGLNKISILQTALQKVFSWKIAFVFWFTIHLSVYLRV